ncbi:polyribonucleotide nucleotidyltransferase [Candidatus Azambacteria bacterium]|nr:polyribonucleotide nucleotidyltransferase [Candidatus Azambacteria bacterium]
METKEFSLQLGSKTLTIRKNILAGQANGAVFVSLGETIVLATAVMSARANDVIDYFPLMVDYEERFYAAGKIMGSRFIKRERRASDEGILTARLIDRALRPLFDHAMRNEVQIVTTVLSIDQENDPDTVSVIAASCALAMSDIPWKGPIGAVRVGKVDGTLVLNPSYDERTRSTMDFVVAGGADTINMIEGDGAQIPEDEVVETLAFAQSYIAQIVALQHKIVKAIGIKKAELKFQETDAVLEGQVKSFLGTRLDRALFEGASKSERMENLNNLKKELALHINGLHPEHPEKAKQAERIFEEEINRIVHENAIHNNRRPDGRKPDELRELASYVTFLPRTHGSGIFIRGETQVLSILTLGAPGDQQWIDTMEKKGFKRFMHHYNFPPFSVGEVKSLRGPSRRDIGHGALAERALEHLIPEQKEFPYTIRVVSETLSSNGSSSMASVCAATLAMMDGGIPMKAPAAGIAMGLMSDASGKYTILTDIQGPEDHHGDMDFKVAGTKDGVTAIQMDVKVDGVAVQVLAEALAQARKARLEILEVMRGALAEPRKELSQYAPRIITLQINPDKIKDVIGPGGKMINEIIDETGVAIDIEDDGSVFITSTSQESAEKAVAWIKNITREAVVGEIFQGKVKRIMDFGAFVEIFPGTEGLVHVSQLSDAFIKNPHDVVKMGDIIPVKLMEIDSQGRLNLSAKEAQKDQKK